MNILHVALVALGGTLGAISRYGVNVCCQSVALFPVGTLFVNIAGSFIVGLLVYSGISQEVRLFALVGFAGAFTTMSTLAYETLLLLDASDFMKAGVIMGANVILSVGAVFLGKIAAKLFVH